MAGEKLNGNVLVTGATGLLGTHICQELAARGKRVVIIERDIVPSSRLYLEGIDRKVITARGDMRDPGLLSRVINEYDVDLVFHLGAQTQVRNAYNMPENTFDVNLTSTWKLFEAVRTSRTGPRVIVASSDKAYGDLEKLPYTEDMEPRPVFPYDVSKRCTELIALSFCRTYGIKTVVTRLSNIYGGGDLNWDRLIPYAIMSILKEKDIIMRSDGTPTREYIYVKDALDAYLRLADNIEKLNGEFFNVGSGKWMQALEVVSRISELMGSTKKPLIRNNAANAEIKNQYLSTEKIKKSLGWTPKWTFDDGLTETIEWYRKYHSSLR